MATATQAKKKTANKPELVLVTTSFRGVFVGYLPGKYEPGQERVTLTDVVMVTKWGTTGWLPELCQTGPTSKTQTSTRAPQIELRSITGVWGMTEAAAKAWEARK